MCPPKRLRSMCAAAVLGTVFLLFPALRAESVLNFPRLSSEQDSLTGVAIVNPSSETALVTITAYGIDGQPLTGINNPVQINIQSNQQFSRTTGELFGAGLAPSTVGWFQARSPTDELTGFFLFLNTSFTVFDGADLPPSAPSIVFSQVRTDADYKTELNIVNPTASAATVELELITPQSPPLTQTLEISPMGVAQLDVETFFGFTSNTPQSYVKATSNTGIAGFEFVSAPEGDLVGLNARSLNEQLTHLYFPQVVVLGPWDTSLGVVNNSQQTVILSISAFTPEGTLYDTENLRNNPVIRTLNAGEARVEDIVSMFEFSVDDPPGFLEGWLQVESTSPAVTGFLTYGLPQTGAAATVTPNRMGQTSAIFSHIATIDDAPEGPPPGFFTGVAILNTGLLAANVRVLAIQADTTPLGNFSTVLQAGQRISKLITELVPDAAGQSGGLIFVRSDLPVHLTSLFGTNSLSVLANIPPQTAPPGYTPDAAIETIEVDPPLAILQPAGSTSFEVAGGATNVSWSVNGAEGGNDFLGTIGPEGEYTAPTQGSLPKTLTITAEVNAQTGGASVDVIEKTTLLTSTRIIQSVAYLNSLDRLYTAELAILSTSSSAGSPDQPAALSLPAQGEVTNSEIFEIVSPGATKQSVALFDDEKIAKIIPFQASNGSQFLLLLAQTSGKVIRFNPQTKELKDVAQGLNQPTAMVLDPNTLNLLVAEQDRVSSLLGLQLELGLVLNARNGGPRGKPQAITVFSAQDVGGVATDQCTGDLYITDTQAGQILRFVALSGELEILYTDLLQPTTLLSVYRGGVTCPQSFLLLAVESGADQVLLLRPGDQLLTPWIPALESTDIGFLPSDSDFTDVPSILLTEALSGEETQQQGGGFSLGIIELGLEQGAILDPTPTNPPDPETLPGIPIGFGDPSLEALVREALGIGNGETITETEALTLIDLDASLNSLQQLDPGLSSIESLDGLESFTNLKTLNLRGHSIGDLTPLAALTQLEVLDLADNDIGFIEPLAALTQLIDLDLGNQDFRAGTFFAIGIRDISALSNLVQLQRLLMPKNTVSDLNPLIGMTQLQFLDLEDNIVNDLTALLANPGLGSGDLIVLLGNSLDDGDCDNIGALMDAGVDVQADPECP